MARRIRSAFCGTTKTNFSLTDEEVNIGAFGANSAVLFETSPDVIQKKLCKFYRPHFTYAGEVADKCP